LLIPADSALALQPADSRGKPSKTGFPKQAYYRGVTDGRKIVFEGDTKHTLQFCIIGGGSHFV
jgi:hypothetical protein